MGVIAPYSSQRKLLKKLFKEHFGIKKCQVEVSTIDGFQGREKDIIIFSCVRAPYYSQTNNQLNQLNQLNDEFINNNSNSIGFLKEKQVSYVY